MSVLLSHASYIYYYSHNSCYDHYGYSAAVLRVRAC